ALAERLHDADRHQVVGGKDRRRRIAARKHRFGGADAAGLVELVVDDDVWDAARLAERGLVTLHPHPLRTAPAGSHGDPPMAALPGGTGDAPPRLSRDRRRGGAAQHHRHRRLRDAGEPGNIFLGGSARHSPSGGGLYVTLIRINAELPEGQYEGLARLVPPPG